VVDYNPFLLAGNSLLFTLFGASDSLARLLPALFGTLLAMSPLFFRRHLGRMGALAAGAYLSISPTALVSARQLDGTMVSAAGTMIFLGGIVRFFESGRPRWLTVAGVSLGLAVAGGAAVYGLVVPLGLAWVLRSQLRSKGDGVGVVSGLSELGRHGARLGVSFGAAVLVFATGLGWNLPGIGAVGDHLASWMSRFGPDPAASASPLLLLAAYELLGTVFGIGGVVWGALEDREPALLMGTWVGFGVAALALMPGRSPTDLIWVVLPLALLTGTAVQAVLRDAWRSNRALHLAYGAIVLVFWANVYLMLARYGAHGDRADLALAAIGVALQGLLGLSFGLVLGAGSTGRTFTAATGGALLAVTLAAGWGVAYGQPADPREALWGRSTASETRELVQTLEDLSWQRTGMPTTLPFAFEAPEDSVLAWTLRDFGQARRVDWLEDLAGDEAAPIIVTMGRDLEPRGAEGQAYTGQDFPLSRTWSPRDLACRVRVLDCSTGVRWFLFRDRVPRPEPDQWVTLWRAGDVAHSD
jgi:hypothetical protein